MGMVKVEREGKGSAGRVTITVDERTAVRIMELAGMTNAVEEVFDALCEAFGEPAAGCGLPAYKRWRQSVAKKYRVREPFINHAGVVVFDVPGKHGEHNRPHFPCDVKRGRGRRA